MRRIARLATNRTNVNLEQRTRDLAFGVLHQMRRVDVVWLAVVFAESASNIQIRMLERGGQKVSAGHTCFSGRKLLASGHNAWLIVDNRVYGRRGR